MTPDQEEQVRLALAAAARAEDETRPASAGAPAHPVPADVAARLDAVLAELVEGRSPASPAAPERDDLAARRRRRVSQLLVAAAAVAVIAAAGGVVANGGLGGSGGSADSAASSTGDKQAPETLTQGSSGSGSAGGGDAAPSAPSPGEAFAAGDVPSLRRATLSSDVRSALRGLDVAARAPQDSTRSRADGAACAVPTAPRGADVVDVRLDGEPATLVALPRKDGTREARVYSCDDGDSPVDVVDVPAR